MAPIKRICVALGVVGLIAICGPDAVVAPVVARIPAADLSYQPVGSIDYIWTGVPDRGCAAVSLCGVQGSLQAAADGSSSGGGNQPQAEVSDFNAVARVVYPAIGGAPARSCADPAPYDVTFALARGRGSGTSPVGESEPNSPASAGQCAGPTAAALDDVTLPVRRELNGDYDLAGTVSLGAGPFQVTVISHLRVRTSRMNASSYFQRPPGSTRQPKGRAALFEQVNVTYRVAAVSAALVDSFSGLPAPLCGPLGACGTSGALRMQLSAKQQTLQFSGDRFVKRRRGLRKALADLHAGRLEVSDDSYGLNVSGRVMETLAGPGVGHCTDTTSLQAADFNSISTRTVDKLFLDPNGNGGPIMAGLDPLRTWCPGPDSNTIVGSGSVAAGAVPFARIGTRKLIIVLSNRGRFDGPGYAGVRTGAIVLSLVRESMSGGTQRIRTFSEGPTS